MERSGLIEREVRGKRTYRISLGPAQAVAVGSGSVAASLAGAGAAASLAGAGAGASLAGAEGAFDYDELARRLLVQVVRRLAVTDAGGEQEDPAVLQETVTGLEQELASAWTRHGKLAEENIRLREQLKVAQQSLALARERLRELPATADLDRSEVALLQRLLSPEYSGPEFGGGPGSDADARRLLS
jgi:hypothetical protein